MTAAQQKMEIDETALENAHQGAHLLIVDDDQPWLNRLGRAMESRGYVVHGAASVSEGIKLGKSVKPAYAVVDMRLEDGNGLDVVENLRAENPDARIIMLTGYGNIATAVEAVKRGAVDYLAKPADADEIHAALVASDGERASPPENPCRLTACVGNIFNACLNYATAMYRRRRGG